MTDFTTDAGTLDVWHYMLLDSYGGLKPLGRQHLPFYSEWGSYPIIYLTKQGNTLCADCATKALYLLDDEFDPPVAYGTHDEGPSEYCDDCGREIESAYGDPDAKKCVIRETMSGFICAECGDNCECIVCAIQEEKQ